MANQLIRSFIVIGAGTAVVALALFLGWKHPSILYAAFLGLFGILWSWLLSRSLDTGVVRVRGLCFRRANSPAEYWTHLGIFFLVGILLLSSGLYTLLCW